MKPTIFTNRQYYSRYHHTNLILYLLITYSCVLVTAQEACVRACTKSAGINECVGSIPHDDAAWDVLDISVQQCYCVAAINFASCSPSCSTEGFSADLLGRVFGQWRYVNQMCTSAVSEFTATASISTNPGYNTAFPTYNSTAVAVTATTTLVNSTMATTVMADVTTTPTPTSTSAEAVAPLPATTEGSSSSNKRTIAISVSLVCVGVLAIGIGLWMFFRNRRRRQIDQNIYETRDAMVIVVGTDGLPIDGADISKYPNPSLMRGDPQNETVKRWIEDQEEARDAMTETLSVGYTLWTDTDLCVTEMGVEDSREMGTIEEDPDGEDTIRRSR